jgi:hypothetical protein
MRLNVRKLPKQFGRRFSSEALDPALDVSGFIGGHGNTRHLARPTYRRSAAAALANRELAVSDERARGKLTTGERDDCTGYDNVRPTAATACWAALSMKHGCYPAAARRGLQLIEDFHELARVVDRVLEGGRILGSRSRVSNAMQASPHTLQHVG